MPPVYGGLPARENPRQPDAGSRRHLATRGRAAGVGPCLDCARPSAAGCPACRRRAAGNGNVHGRVRWPVGELLLDQPERAVAIASIEATKRVLTSAVAVDEPVTLRDHRLGVILGRALAHEIADHLLKTPGHASRGLMRARIGVGKLADFGSGAFFLDAAAARWIREARTSCSTRPCAWHASTTSHRPKSRAEKSRRVRARSRRACEPRRASGPAELSIRAAQVAMAVGRRAMPEACRTANSTALIGGTAGIRTLSCSLTPYDGTSKPPP